jgi:hypothetical protein
MMNNVAEPEYALRSLQRALSAISYPQLRQASVEIDPVACMVRLRFEYDGTPEPDILDACQVAGTEVIADFPASWRIEEEHCSVAVPGTLTALRHVARLLSG